MDDFRGSRLMDDFCGSRLMDDFRDSEVEPNKKKRGGEGEKIETARWIKSTVFLITPRHIERAKRLLLCTRDRKSQNWLTSKLGDQCGSRLVT
ncbi:hypothetical protein YC2023_040251 [Brassica napus]